MLERHDGGLAEIVVSFCILLWIEPAFPDGLDVGLKDSSKAVVLKVVTKSTKYPLHWGTC